MIDRWTFFIKNAERLDFIPDDVKDEGLKSAYLEADEHNWSKAELNAYFDASVQEGDQTNERIKAEQKGKLEGKIEGKLEGKIETAKNLKIIGVATAVISTATGLSEEEIEKL